MNQAPELAKATRTRDVATARSDMYTFDPRTIVVESDWNGRDYTLDSNKAHVEALSRSIVATGHKVPITIRLVNGLPVLADGECRLRATLLAMEQGHLVLESDGGSYKGIPTVTEVRGLDDRDRLLGQILRNAGKPFEPLELATRLSRLMQMGWSEADIAAKMGQSAKWVEDHLTLSELPVAIKEAIADKTITPTVALAESRKVGTSAVVEVVNEAKAKGEKVKKATFEARGGHEPTKNYKKADALHMVRVFGDMKTTCEAGDLTDAEVREKLLGYVTNILENYGALA